MTRHLIAFLSGALFALELALGGMTRPHKVRAFLDFTGSWDPSLLLVMGGAVVVYALFYRSSKKRAVPWCGGEFSTPAERRIDARLVGGAAVFGVGWGLAGFCPGPAIVALATGNGSAFLFVAAMIAGMSLTRGVQHLPHTDRAQLAGRSARDG